MLADQKNPESSEMGVSATFCGFGFTDNFLKS